MKIHLKLLAAFAAYSCLTNAQAVEGVVNSEAKIANLSYTLESTVAGGKTSFTPYMANPGRTEFSFFYQDAETTNASGKSFTSFTTDQYGFASLPGSVASATKEKNNLTNSINFSLADADAAVVKRPFLYYQGADYKSVTDSYIFGVMSAHTRMTVTGELHFSFDVNESKLPELDFYKNEIGEKIGISATEEFRIYIGAATKIGGDQKLVDEFTFNTGIGEAVTSDGSVVNEPWENNTAAPFSVTIPFKLVYESGVTSADVDVAINQTLSSRMSKYVSPVPELSTYALMAIGLIGIAAVVRRSRLATEAGMA